MDVRYDLLTPSDTTSVCPYKVRIPDSIEHGILGLIPGQGWANYFDVQLPNGEVHKDIVWYYRAPNAECIRIMGLLAFYDEKVTVWVDDEKQE